MDTILTGCMKCPQCHELPVIVINSHCPMPYMLVCERHGHAAMGSNKKQLIDHWNYYIEGLLTVLPDTLRSHKLSKVEEAIFNATHGIMKGEL